MTNQDDQIVLLNQRVKLKIAPSKIHGVGVFTIRDVSKDEKLYADHAPVVYNLPYSSFGKLFSEVKELLLERWPRIIDGSNFIYPDARLLAYMNHGEGKKENYDAINDVVLKDIKEGEEVLEDYKKIPNWDKIFTFLLDTKKK